MTRRPLLHRGPGRAVLGTVLAVLVSAPLLSACGGDDPADPSSGSGSPAASSTELPSSPVDASIQLGWFPNVESAAFVMADEDGEYEERNVNATLLPGGPNVTVAPLIESGNVLVGLLSLERFADAVSQGADLVAVGAEYQTATSAIVSLASSPIETPKDLEGKRFGVSASDTQTYTAFFAMNDVDTSKIEFVSTNGNAAALTAGEVDAISSTIPNDPVVLAAQGVQTHQLRLADYDFNRWSGLLVVARASLEDPAKRAAIGAVLQASAAGEQTAIDDPERTAQTVVDVYGQSQGLQYDAQLGSLQEWNELATAGSVADDGLFRITEEGKARAADFLEQIGSTVDLDTAFDLSVGEDYLG